MGSYGSASPTDRWSPSRRRTGARARSVPSPGSWFGGADGPEWIGGRLAGSLQHRGEAADARGVRAGRPAPTRAMTLNAMAGMLPLAVGLVLMRVQLGALGPKAFGAWSLVTAAVAMMATLDLGLAASLFRFFGVNGDRERAASDRLL